MRMPMDLVRIMCTTSLTSRRPASVPPRSGTQCGRNSRCATTDAPHRWQIPGEQVVVADPGRRTEPCCPRALHPAHVLTRVRLLQARTRVQRLHRHAAPLLHATHRACELLLHPSATPYPRGLRNGTHSHELARARASCRERPHTMPVSAVFGRCTPFLAKIRYAASGRSSVLSSTTHASSCW